MKQKRLSLGARFGLAVASFLLGILLFVSAIATTLIADVRTVTAKDNIRDFIREIFVESISGPTHIHAKVPAASGAGSPRIIPTANRKYGVLRRDDPSGIAADLTDRLIDMFYDEVRGHIAEQMPVSKDEFTRLINESTVKDYIAEKTAGLIADYFAGEVTTTFEPEEIVALIEQNEELIVSVTGSTIPADMVQEIAALFEQNEIIQKVEAEGLAGFLEASDSSIPGLSDGSQTGDLSSISFNDIIDALRATTSTSNFVWSIVICLVLIASIILINIRQLSKGLRRAGYPLLLAGLGIVPCLLAHFSPDLWTAAPELILVQKLLRQVTVVYAIVFGIGLALIIGGIVLGIVLRRRSKSTVTVPATSEVEEPAVVSMDVSSAEVSCGATDGSHEEEPAEVPVTEATAPADE